MDPHTGVLPGLKVMVDRAARWKFSWQQSPLAACPQEVKDGVEDGTKVGWCAVARPVAPPAELAQPGPTPRWSGRCRRIERASYGPFGPGSALFQDRRQLFKHPLRQRYAGNTRDSKNLGLHRGDEISEDRVKLRNHWWQAKAERFSSTARPRLPFLPF